MVKARRDLGQRLEQPIDPELRLLDIAKELGVLPEGATLIDLKPSVYSQMIRAHNFNHAKNLGYLSKDAGRKEFTDQVRIQMMRDGNWAYFLPYGSVTGWASSVLERRLYRPPDRIL